MTKKHFRI